MAGSADPSSIALAAASLKRIRRARGVARFNGWCGVVLGVPALAFGFWSPTSAVVGVALIVLGVRELRLGERLTRLDVRACRGLAMNQLALLAGILAYCGWMTVKTLGAAPLSERMPELEQALGQSMGSAEEIDALARGVMVAVYLVVAVMSVGFQGLTAWYYASRRMHAERLLAMGEGPTLSAREAAAA